jgi:hypothetical protein
MAFAINLYNALVIHALVVHGPQQYNSSTGRIGFFQKVRLAQMPASCRPACQSALAALQLTCIELKAYNINPGTGRSALVWCSAWPPFVHQHMYTI